MHCLIWYCSRFFKYKYGIHFQNLMNFEFKHSFTNIWWFAPSGIITVIFDFTSHPHTMDLASVQKEHGPSSKRYFPVLSVHLPVIPWYTRCGGAAQTAGHKVISMLFWKGGLTGTQARPFCLATLALLLFSVCERCSLKSVWVWIFLPWGRRAQLIIWFKNQWTWRC